MSGQFPVEILLLGAISFVLISIVDLGITTQIQIRRQLGLLSVAETGLLNFSSGKIFSY